MNRPGEEPLFIGDSTGKNPSYSLEEEKAMGEPGPRLRRQQDEQVRRLTDHYLSAHHLPPTPENQARFVAVYECFLRATPPKERRADRLDRLVRAAFGIQEATGLDPQREETIAAELADLSARYEEEQRRRGEEEGVRKQVQEELRQVSGVVSSAYQELSARLEEHRVLLAEREAALAREEEEYRARLASIAELERELQSQLERRLHRDATSAVEAQVAALSSELEAVRAELGDMALEESEDSPFPLAAAVRRLATRAATAGLDALTGLPSRGAFNEAIARRIEDFRAAARAGRGEQENYTLLFIDIDHFKGVNDAHGHVAGDRVLAAVGERLRSLRRAMDRAYRFGGEELVCILPRTPAAGATNVAEVLRDQIADIEVVTPKGERIQVTVSIGLCDALSSGAAIVHCADQALYRAKEEGRNRTVTFSEEAFVAPIPRHLPEPFVTAVRHRLLCEEPFAMVAVEVAGATREETLARLEAAFPGPTADDGEQRFLLVDGADGAEAIQRLEAAVAGIPIRAGSTDTDEIPDARSAPPATRAQLLLTQLVELLA